MKHLITFETEDFYFKMLDSYRNILNSVTMVAIMYVKNISTINTFEFYIRDTNKVISSLRSLFPEYDERRNYFELISITEIIEQTKKYLETDDF